MLYIMTVGHVEDIDVLYIMTVEHVEDGYVVHYDSGTCKGWMCYIL